MKALLTVGCVVAGMGLGGGAGFVLALFKAPMDPEGFEVMIGLVAGGAAAGAVAGAVVAGALA